MEVCNVRSLHHRRSIEADPQDAFINPLSFGLRHCGVRALNPLSPRRSETGVHGKLSYHHGAFYPTDVASPTKSSLRSSTPLRLATILSLQQPLLQALQQLLPLSGLSLAVLPTIRAARLVERSAVNSVALSEMLLATLLGHWESSSGIACI